jgi:hypothetical protein
MPERKEKAQVSAGLSRIGPQSPSTVRVADGERTGHHVPNIADDLQLAAVNAAYGVMCDETELPDDFDAAQSMAMAAINAFVEVDAEWSPAARGSDVAARGGTDGDVTEVDAERLIDKLLDYDLLADPEDSQRNMVIACDLIRTIRRGGTEEERPTMDQHAAVIEALADANRYEDEPTVGEIEAAAVYIYEEDRAPSSFRKWAALRVHDYPLGKAHYRSKARAILAVARATSIRESEA